MRNKADFGRCKRKVHGVTDTFPSDYGKFMPTDMTIIIVVSSNWTCIPNHLAVCYVFLFKGKQVGDTKSLSHIIYAANSPSNTFLIDSWHC